MKNPLEITAQIMANFTDEKLFELCHLYGGRARFWRQKFEGLLPEVLKRRLYLQKGFESIYVFAAKLAGMNERQVDSVLHLEKKFEGKPILHPMLLNGEVSVNKLARIASVATAENQEFWATQVKLLPKAALETLVRDEKYAIGLQENNLIEKLMPGHNGDARSLFSQELNFSSEVSQKLLELQQKGIDVNALLLDFLEKRELEIEQKKEKLSAEAKPTNSRHVAAATEKLLEQEYGEKCSIKTCPKPAVVIHHSQRYALSKIHDPKYLAPLCKEHHQIAHSIDQKYHRARIAAHA